MLVVVLAFFTWSGIAPYDRETWFLEMVPAFIFLLGLVFTYHRFRFSTMSYFIIMVLLIFVAIGGHYTYERVPLFNWIKDHFHLKRNHYDRVGHFAKGFIVIPLRELLLRKTELHRGKLLTVILISFVLSFAALYEIGEWLVAEVLGRSAHDFLGTQGDVWDSEWDMALATLGSVVAFILLSKWHDKKIDSE